MGGFGGWFRRVRGIGVGIGVAASGFGEGELLHEQFDVTLGPDGKAAHVFQSGEPMSINLRVSAKDPVDDYVFGIGLLFLLLSPGLALFIAIKPWMFSVYMLGLLAFLYFYRAYFWEASLVTSGFFAMKA